MSEIENRKLFDYVHNELSEKEKNEVEELITRDPEALKIVNAGSEDRTEKLETHVSKITEDKGDGDVKDDADAVGEVEDDVEEEESINDDDSKQDGGDTTTPDNKFKGSSGGLVTKGKPKLATKGWK